MVIEERRKGKYKAGTIDINKTSGENLAMCMKICRFISGFSRVTERDRDRFDFDCFKFPQIYNQDVQFVIDNVTCNLTQDKVIDVHFDFRERTVTLYGSARSSTSKFAVNESRLQTRSLDEVYRKLLEWYMPLREIKTVVTTADKYNTANPAGGNIRSIDVISSYGPNCQCGTGEIILHKEFDIETGDETNGRVGVTVYGELGEKRIKTSEYFITSSNGITIEDEFVFSNDTFTTMRNGEVVDKHVMKY